MGIQKKALLDFLFGVFFIKKLCKRKYVKLEQEYGMSIQDVVGVSCISFRLDYFEEKKMIGSRTMGFATVLFGYCGLFGLDYCLQLSIGRLLKKSSLFCHFVWTMVDYF